MSFSTSHILNNRPLLMQDPSDMSYMSPFEWIWNDHETGLVLEKVRYCILLLDILKTLQRSEFHKSTIRYTATPNFHFNVYKKCNLRFFILPRCWDSAKCAISSPKTLGNILWYKVTCFYPIAPHTCIENRENIGFCTFWFQK